ncbi:nectin-3-like [Discoglossus pictus]
MKVKELCVICLWYCEYIIVGSVKVISVEHVSAAVGGNVTFQCQLRPNTNVLQVTWEKESGNFTGPMAAYSASYGTKLLGEYSNRMVQFTTVGQNASAITLCSVNPTDQGCFKCIFNVFPIGATTGRVCLEVYETQISQTVLETYPMANTESSVETYVVSCAVTGKPAPEITWNLTDSLLVTPHLYSIHHPDQSVTIISNFTWTPGRLQRTEVSCVVRHPALSSEKVLSEFIGRDTESDIVWIRLVIIIFLTVITFVVVFLLCYLHRKKKADEKKIPFFISKNYLQADPTHSCFHWFHRGRKIISTSVL